MSAFTVGTQSARMDPQNQKIAYEDNDAGPGKAFIKWIPGDAIVFYTALLALGAKQVALKPNSTAEERIRWIDVGSAEWFVFALASAALLVLVGSVFTNRGKRPAILPLITRILLTLVAFTIWTTLLPGSWTYNWYWVRDMGDAYVLVVGIAAVVFTAIAESLTRVCDRPLLETVRDKLRTLSAKFRDPRKFTGLRKNMKIIGTTVKNSSERTRKAAETVHAPRRLVPSARLKRKRDVNPGTEETSSQEGQSQKPADNRQPTISQPSLAGDRP